MEPYDELEALLRRLSRIEAQELYRRLLENMAVELVDAPERPWATAAPEISEILAMGVPQPVVKRFGAKMMSWGEEAAFRSLPGFPHDVFTQGLRDIGDTLEDLDFS